METIIVEIYVPATSRSFDFRLPAGGRIYDIATEIIRILEATQQDQFFDKSHPLLCDIDHGRILNPALTVAECGLRDSTRLMLT